MAELDLYALQRLSRAAADLGHYNLAKLLTAASLAVTNRELYAESLPKTDRELAEAVAAIEPLLQTTVDDRLLEAIHHARSLIADQRLVLYVDAPPLYVCRVCGEVAWRAAPAQCPFCGAGALVFQLLLPAFYLEPDPAPVVMEHLSHTPIWLGEVLDGLSPDQAARRIGGAEGTWSLTEAAGHLLDTQELIARRVDLFLDNASPNLNAQAMWQVVEASRLTIAEIVVNFRRSRHAMLTRLRSASPDVWLRVGQHNEFGPVTLQQQCTYFAKHEQWHMAQMTRLRRTLDQGEG
jgi:uncharacterized damage-inducible protein DinB